MFNRPIPWATEPVRLIDFEKPLHMVRIIMLGTWLMEQSN